MTKEKSPCNCSIEYDENNYPVTHLCKEHREDENERLKENTNPPIEEWEERFNELIERWNWAYPEQADKEIRNFIYKELRALDNVNEILVDQLLTTQENEVRLEKELQAKDNYYKGVLREIVGETGKEILKKIDAEWVDNSSYIRKHRSPTRLRIIEIIRAVTKN